MPNAFPGNDPGAAQRIDQNADGNTYFGWAAPGSATSDAVWAIQRLRASGTETIIEWADGNQTYDNVWNNRTSLTYSQ